MRPMGKALKPQTQATRYWNSEPAQGLCHSERFFFAHGLLSYAEVGATRSRGFRFPFKGAEVLIMTGSQHAIPRILQGSLPPVALSGKRLHTT